MSWAHLSSHGRVGVLGGSFDPPHCGHVLLAAYALSVAPIDAVLVVPTFSHPFAKRMAPFEERVAMARAAFSVLDPARIAVSDIERELEAPSYTWRTLEALAARMPAVSLRLLVGSDIVKDTAKWARIERVEELAPLFVIGRGDHVGGAEHAPLELPAVSSTVVRERLARGGTAVGLVPASVATHIAERGLYRGHP